jgi:hypothetical protein
MIERMQVDLDIKEGENEEFTVMDGFNYRVNDTVYPVYRGDKPAQDYPIIPIGMLEIWR